MSTGRLKWQCRRGSKELDLLLNHYLDNSYPQASLEEQQHFADLLKQEDDQLHAILHYHNPNSPTLLKMLIEKINPAQKTMCREHKLLQPN